MIGRSHLYHGGIGPSRTPYLSENSTPAWILVPTSTTGVSRPDDTRIVWNPTVEHMLEDGLLMIAIHVLKAENVLKLARGAFQSKDMNQVALYDDIDANRLLELHQTCRRLAKWYKIVVTILDGSTILRQVPVLEEYAMEVEVCLPVFLRDYSAWTEETVVKGSPQGHMSIVTQEGF